jgi:hypothetical protein
VLAGAAGLVDHRQLAEVIGQRRAVDDQRGVDDVAALRHDAEHAGRRADHEARACSLRMKKSPICPWAAGPVRQLGSRSRR